VILCNLWIGINVFFVTYYLHLQDRNCRLHPTACGRLLQTLTTDVYCVASQITATASRTSNFKSFIRHQDKNEYLFIDCKFQFYLSNFVHAFCLHLKECKRPHGAEPIFIIIIIIVFFFFFFFFFFCFINL
jgi:hypothetical protein